MKEIIVDKAQANQRLDKYLKRVFREAGSGFLYKMLRKKNIVLLVYKYPVRFLRLNNILRNHHKFVRNITENNGCITSGQNDLGKTVFHFSKSTNRTFHLIYLLSVKLSDHFCGSGSCKQPFP